MWTVSTTLATELSNVGISVTDTIQTNRKGVPTAVKKGHKVRAYRSEDGKGDILVSMIFLKMSMLAEFMFVKFGPPTRVGFTVKCIWAKFTCARKRARTTLIKRHSVKLKSHDKTDHNSWWKEDRYRKAVTRETSES